MRVLMASISAGSSLMEGIHAVSHFEHTCFQFFFGHVPYFFFGQSQFIASQDNAHAPYSGIYYKDCSPTLYRTVVLFRWDSSPDCKGLFMQPASADEQRK